MSTEIRPLNSIRVAYQYGKSSGYFYIGQFPNGRWWWECLGNNGEEDTANRAIEAGRIWITETRTVKIT